MKNSVVIVACALVATIAYGVFNYFLETRLSSYNFIACVWVVDVICAIMGGVVLLGMKARGVEITFPIGPEVIWVSIGIAILYYCGSLFDFFAYSIGGKAFVITTIFIAMPITVAILMFVNGKGLPKTYQVVAFALVVTALIIFAIGNHSEVEAIEPEQEVVKQNELIIN